MANGVLKAFLLQSGLSPTITHYQFFERLFSRYFTKKRGKVYGGPNGAAEHKNAWNTPVLNKDMKMFEWMCMPAVTPQQAVTGISVNLSMRLVHYVLLQGLGITTDWRTASHENSTFVSCVQPDPVCSRTRGSDLVRQPCPSSVPNGAFKDAHFSFLKIIKNK